MVQGHSRPVESGSRKNGGSHDGISRGGPCEPSLHLFVHEVAMVEMIDHETICPVCNGSGESPWGPVGKEVCWKCGGDGLLREIEDYEDLNEWERSMGW